MTRAALALVATLALGGCSSLPLDHPQFDSTLILPRGQSVSTPPQYKSKIIQPEPRSCVDFNSRFGDQPTRNECILDLVTDIDAAYFAYEARINDYIGSANASADAASAAASTLSTAVGGTGAKTALSTISSLISGTQSFVDKDILYQQTVKILVNQMHADRAKILAEVRLRLTEPVATYTMAAARNDLVSYLYAGTLTSALNAVAANTGAAANKCQAADTAAKAATAAGKTGGPPGAKPGAPASTTTAEVCEQLIEASYKPTAASQEILAEIAPDHVLDRAKSKVLRGCMRSLGLPPVVALIDTDKVSEVDRLRVFACYVDAQKSTSKKQTKPELH